MNNTIFKATNLSKMYKSAYALNGLNMEIKKGDIYGFIGENGAGKTTLVRILTGLSEKTEGTMSLFGADSNEGITKERSRTGAIVESPAFYPNMTARDNLEISRRLRGIPDKGQIEKVLKEVSLDDTGKKKVKDFSMGMKQRLGIANALLGEPEFLVLDEPTNGLDPASIVEIRLLLKDLSKNKGITILISSHILSEVYQLATKFGFISKGRIIEELSLEELNERCQKYILLKVDNTSKAVGILETKLSVNKIQVMYDDAIKIYECLDDLEKVARELSLAGLVVSEITIKGDDLESYYMRLIGGGYNA